MKFQSEKKIALDISELKPVKGKMAHSMDGLGKKGFRTADYTASTWILVNFEFMKEFLSATRVPLAVLSIFSLLALGIAIGIGKYTGAPHTICKSDSSTSVTGCEIGVIEYSNDKWLFISFSKENGDVEKVAIRSDNIKSIR